MIKSKLKERLNARVCMYFRSRYELIKPLPIQGLFNYKCFYNVAEYVRLNDEIGIVEVVYIDDGYPVLHYLNYDPATQEYLETTLGFLAEQNEYYKIRSIHPSDYNNIAQEFSRSRDSWNNQFLKWYHKLVLIDTCV